MGIHGVGELEVRDAEGGATISVKVVPGSSRDRIVGVLGDCLKVATAAPAEKGRANRAVAAILAKALGVSSNALTLVSGTRSARKEFLISGLSARGVRARISSRL